MVPVVPFKLNPSDIGVGLIVHSVGLPEAVSGKLKACPTVPEAVPALVITGAVTVGS